ncbi:cellulase family glycosylhydrolase [Aquimarina sp. 2304DJ70-9]|uniref:cellulase family glycosylhydrolase n=1 Tax=Aquimarina penaris TaxID=3231044 RepID=UPI003461814A
MKSKKTCVIYLVIFIATYLIPNCAQGQSIVDQNGRLRVLGNKVVNKNNKPLSLAGNSLFWSNWDVGGKFYNSNTVSHLAKEWKSDIVRAAMGVEEEGGYITNSAREKNKVKAVVEAAIAEGIYVIIDWHTHKAEEYQEEAIDFFTEMAQLYGNNDHVIYEVYNEPVFQSWSTVKSYANAVVNAIRAVDPDNLIIIGTPQWSQKVVDASNDPLTQNNIAYTLHFYAGDHKQFLRDEATKAMNNGIALFVTEWGAVNANGDGGADKPETEKWMQFLKDNHISHANWSVSDKVEGASVVAGNAGVSGLLANNLTETGFYLKNIIENWNNTTVPTMCTGNGQNISNLIQAEDFCAQSGIRFEATTDTGGGQNAGYIESGDYMDYRLDLPETGQYTINFRVAAFNQTIKFYLFTGDTMITSVNSSATGGWQNWKTVTETIDLSAGNQTFRIAATGNNWNINWFQIIKNVVPPGPCTDNGQSITGLIQAEDFCAQSGIRFEATTDTGGGQNAGYIESGDYMDHRLNVPETAQYTINFRVAASSENIKFDLLLGNTIVTSVNESPTGGWQSWKTVTRIINLSKGSQTLRLMATGNYWNINWFQIIPTTNLNENDVTVVRLYPIPAEDFLNVTGIDETSLIYISDFTGRAILQSKINFEHNKIDISSLKGGNYILTIIDGSQKRSFQFTKK